ncbi:hypothetical protein ABG768_021927 [Culter alburnus]|uniref:Uncharacterized protein n=1 Tax=Culter alburnus TaxID=194366 RepID=A0AAW2ATA0_CULAL
MLSFMVLLTLAIHPCLSEAVENPDKPCVEERDEKRFDTFLKHHLNKDIPKNEEVKEWRSFIDKIDTWKRPSQSFFRFSNESEKDNVIAVCSTGGKKHKGNLCISKEKLNFIHVTIDNNNVMKVTKKYDYVILACDKVKVKNKCLPVHFEKNGNGATPGNTQDCS